MTLKKSLKPVRRIRTVEDLSILDGCFLAESNPQSVILHYLNQKYPRELWNLSPSEYENMLREDGRKYVRNSCVSSLFFDVLWDEIRRRNIPYSFHDDLCRYNYRFLLSGHTDKQEEPYVNTKELLGHPEYDVRYADKGERERIRASVLTRLQLIG